MRIIKDILYGTLDVKRHGLNIYLPDEVEEADVLIFFHGGGMVAGDKEGEPITRLTDLGKVAISANYRMYPDAAYPDFIEDAAMAVNWVKEHIQEYVKMKKLFVGGGSAGAYLTAMLAYDKRYLNKYGIKTTDINGYLIDSGQVTTHMSILTERGMDSRQIVVDEAAPVYHVNKNTEFPNIMVVLTDNDWPGRLEQNMMFIKTLEIFGCPKEKITYKMIKGFKHGKYGHTDEYIYAVKDFMDTSL